MMIKKKISPICFNHYEILFIEIEDSAQKHYRDQSVTFFEKIALTLDGQVRDPDDTNRLGEAVYHVASCTSFAIAGKNYEYRDTCFKEYSDRQALRFFHGSQRRETEHEKFPQKFKQRLE